MWSATYRRFLEVGVPEPFDLGLAAFAEIGWPVTMRLLDNLEDRALRARFRMWLFRGEEVTSEEAEQELWEQEAAANVDGWFAELDGG